MLGKPVPDFSVPRTGGSTFRLSGARGTRLVLYFYPKDNTPACGVSRDTLKSHEGFKAKMKLLSASSSASSR